MTETVIIKQPTLAMQMLIHCIRSFSLFASIEFIAASLNRGIDM